MKKLLLLIGILFVTSIVLFFIAFISYWTTGDFGVAGFLLICTISVIFLGPIIFVMSKVERKLKIQSEIKRMDGREKYKMKRK